MVHQNYPNSKNIIQVFSEDIAEIRNGVYEYAMSHYKNGNRKEELMKIMDDIYNGLFMNCTPVILIDKDGRNMQEYKTVEKEGISK